MNGLIMQDTINVSATKIMSDLTIRVHLTKTNVLAWRIAVGKILLRAAALVIGCHIEVES